MAEKSVLVLGGRAHGERYRTPKGGTVLYVARPLPPATFVGEDEKPTVALASDAYERRKVFIGDRLVEVFVPLGTDTDEADRLLFGYLADVLEGKEVP